MVPRFGTDGIRGAANAELTPELALALGRAAARHLDGAPFLVGRDTRQSGPMLQAALSAGLSASGRDVVDVGVIPTPGPRLAGRLAAAAGGDDLGLPQPLRGQRHQAARPRGRQAGPRDRAGDRARPARPRGRFRAGRTAGRRCAGGSAGRSRASRCRARRRRRLRRSPRRPHAGRGRCPTGLVVVDCANGAASAVAPGVLDRLGVRNQIALRLPRRDEHQRRLRVDPPRAPSRRRSSGPGQPSASPSTATPTGCSPSTTGASLSTAIS